MLSKERDAVAIFVK